MKWIALQPLIGGMAIAAENAFGTPPSAVISYKGIGNCDYYVSYLNDVKKYNVNHYRLNDGAYSLTEEFENDENGVPVTTWDNELFKDLDCVIAVPICAGLSGANCASNDSEYCKGSDAIQNNNMLGCLNIVMNHLKPKVYMFENAYALATNLGEGIREKIIKIANDAGYGVNIVKVNTLNHGIPQHRKRTFVICCKDSNAIKLNYDGPKQVKTLKELFKDLPETVDKGNCPEIDKAWIQYMKDKYGENYRESWENNNKRSIDEIAFENGDLEECKKYFKDNPRGIEIIEHILNKTKNGKGWMSGAPSYSGESLSPAIYTRTITKLWHPTEERHLCVREIMRLMCLPDDFPEVPRSKAPIIGQNVVVTTAQYYCEQVKDWLDGKAPTHNEKNIIQDFSKREKSKNKIKAFWKKT